MEPCVERLQPSLSRSAIGATRSTIASSGDFLGPVVLHRRDEEWTQPGSFRVVDVAGESVIVVRGETARFAPT